MSLWAVNLALLCATQTAAADLAFDSVRQSVVTLPGSSGYAVLIDSVGLFMAHAALVNEQVFTANGPSGESIQLRVLLVDQPSQLALLQATKITDVLGMKPTSTAGLKDVEGKKLFALSNGKSFPGDYQPGQRVALMQPTNRYVPVGEIRFESRFTRVGGALVFTPTGRIAGVLSGALEPVQDPSARKSGQDSSQNYGPAGLTVGYTLGPEILQRVITGFRSADHIPKHPTLGIFFTSAEKLGATIVRVTEGGPGDNAGLKTGDTVLSVNKKTVRNSLELAAELFKLEVGSTARLGVLRADGQSAQIEVKVGNFGDASSGAKVSNGPAQRLRTLKRIHPNGVSRMDLRSGHDVVQV
ncbi:MAG: PDZ domain-containing protein [Chthonomonas sp.]|nr:PDZ domain-containing protein [Chthonomonas sp.]